MRRMVLFALVLSLGAGAFAPGPQTQPPQSFSPWVDGHGNISLPEDFRTTWSHLGDWVVPEEGGLSFHEVYSEGDSVGYFNRHRQFPDGATLVKEVRSSRSAQMTTGHASWAADNQIWFVMVKDALGRFKDNPVWGDGWGWALFSSDNPQVSVTKDYRQECLPCHLPAKENDWVYVEGYPTLKSVSRSAAMKPSRGSDDLPENSVRINMLTYSPQTLTVKAGTTVTWINEDPFPHTATADGGSFDTGNIGQNQRASVTFNKPGTFPYTCTPHPFMKGIVQVEE